jgi:hypothetical protein
MDIVHHSSVFDGHPLAPPPELSLSSLTWKISNVSKVATFDIPPASPMSLGLVCVSEIIVSPEIL